MGMMMPEQSELPALEPIEAESEQGGGEGEMKGRMGFRTAEERCGSCAHHDQGMCRKGGFQCDDEDTCGEYQPGGEDVADYEAEEEEELPELA